jgi:hypothetical protein
MAEELYAFRVGRATTDLFFEIRQFTEKKMGIWKRVYDGIRTL